MYRVIKYEKGEAVKEYTGETHEDVMLAAGIKPKQEDKLIKNSIYNGGWFDYWIGDIYKPGQEPKKPKVEDEGDSDEDEEDEEDDEETGDPDETAEQKQLREAQEKEAADKKAAEEAAKKEAKAKKDAEAKAKAGKGGNSQEKLKIAGKEDPKAGTAGTTNPDDTNNNDPL